MMKLIIIEPQTEEHRQRYYQFRWKLLREPWQQVKGSEKDELENTACHRMAMLKSQVVGVGRLHRVDQLTAQIRYMAVHDSCRGQHVGSMLLSSLEQAALAMGVSKLVLHSRESTCGFYMKNGYTLGDRSHILYGVIVHFYMHKKL